MPKIIFIFLSFLITTQTAYASCSYNQLGKPGTWFINLPPASPDRSPQICRLIFDINIIISGVCFDASQPGKVITDYMVNTLSLKPNVSLDKDCTLTATLPFKEAGEIRINAELTTNVFAGFYFSSRNPGGIAFQALKAK